MVIGGQKVMMDMPGKRLMAGRRRKFGSDDGGKFIQLAIFDIAQPASVVFGQGIEHAPMADN